MIRILQRYILVEVLRIYVLALAVLSFIILMGQLLRYWHHFRLGVGQVVVAMPFLVPSVLTFAMPVAVLVATTFAFGRMASDNEIVAVRAAGIHLGPLLMPAVLVALVVVLAALVLHNNVNPYSIHRTRRLARENINVYARHLRNQRYLRLPPFAIFVDDMIGDRFIGIHIHRIAGDDSGTGSGFLQIDAREGDLSPGPNPGEIILNLRQCGMLQKQEGSGELAVLSHVESMPFRLSIQNSGRLEAYERTTSELLRMLGRTDSTETRRDIAVTIHERFSLSTICLAFVFLGMPLGLLSRQGNVLYAFGIACVPVFVLWYPLHIIGKSFAESGKVPVWVGLWSGNVVILALGIAMCAVVFRK